MAALRQSIAQDRRNLEASAAALASLEEQEIVAVRDSLPPAYTQQTQAAGVTQADLVEFGAEFESRMDKHNARADDKMNAILGTIEEMRGFIQASSQSGVVKKRSDKKKSKDAANTKRVTSMPN